MTTNISPTSIVVEVLRDDNYDDWSACMKSYMIAHDLWDLIEPAHHQEGDQEVDSTSSDHPEDDQEVDSTPIDHREGDQEVDSMSTNHREGDQEVDSTLIDHPEGDHEGNQEVDSMSTDHREGDQEVDSLSTDHREGDQEIDSTSSDHPEGDQEVDSTSIDHPEGDHEGDQEVDSTPSDHPEGDQEIDSTSTDHREGDQEIDSTSTDHREGDQEVDSKAWRKKNAAALHAIQVSCSPRILSKIRSIFSAKEAWDSLANSLFVEAESSQGSGAVSDERNGPLLDLYKYAHNGDWNAIENYLRQYPDAIKAKIKPYGGTALHVAIYAGNLNVVEELVRLMSEEDLQIQDDKGNTALFSAATVGITKMAKCLVNKNPNLLTFVNEDKQIPLTVACLKNCKEMALYLYSVTPDQFLCQDNGHHGSDLLQCAIILQMLDIAYDFLYRHPNMTTTMDDGIAKSNALMILTAMPGIFPSGSRLSLWQQWIYSCIRIPPIATPDDNFRIYIPDQSLSGSRNNTLQVLSKFRGFAINLLTFLGIKQIYDLKKIHMYSDKILRCMCEHVSKLGYEEGLDADIIEAFHSAVGNGIAEYVVEVVKACPYLIHRIDYRSRSPFMSSIANRHEKVFSLFYRLEASRATFVRPIDGLGDTMLRLAAKLSPPSQLSRVSGAALQMQRELQWFKEVESIMNPLYEDNVDEYIQTSRELFTHEHKDLLVKGEQWMKQAATSCTVVGALIITIMFNAAFNVPGGNIQQTGYPVFKDKKSFTIFIVADAISFFSSSTSVLMFLGILTSRYAEEDFLKSLPTKLIFGLSTLFLSIAAMMVTFCTALIIMLNGRLKIIIPVVLLASIPVTFFIFLQFPLLVEIYGSTYGPGIVNKKMKRWY
ncbi:hypothetical protein OIU76_028847 [Salix suchowensis]|nr:hypothetical protein OIU76_028847 [Salix suchowensis]